MSKLSSIGKFNNSLNSNIISSSPVGKSLPESEKKKPFIQINTSNSKDFPVLGKVADYLRNLGFAILGMKSPTDDAQQLIDKAKLQSLESPENTSEMAAADSETDPVIDNWPASFLEKDDNKNIENTQQKVKNNIGLINTPLSNGSGANSVGSELNFSA
jgi:hypothetical protein